jgi:hypothetical protein
VLKADRGLAELWRYRVQGGACESAFAGDRPFLRGGDRLYRIGGATPATPEEPEIVPLKAAAIPAGAPVQAFVNDVTPNAWVVAGPFAGRDLGKDYLAGLGGRAAAIPKAGDTAKLAGEEAAFRALGAADFYTEPRFTNGMKSVELMAALGKKAGSSGVFATVIDNDVPRYVQFRLLTPDGIGWNYKQRLEARAWIAGQPLDEKAVYKMEQGRYPLLLQASIGQVEGWGRIWMAPRLVDVTRTTEAKLTDYARCKAGWAAYQASLGERFVLAP